MVRWECPTKLVLGKQLFVLTYPAVHTCMKQDKVVGCVYLSVSQSLCLASKYWGKKTKTKCVLCVYRDCTVSHSQAPPLQNENLVIVKVGRAWYRLFSCEYRKVAERT